MSDALDKIEALTDNFNPDDWALPFLDIVPLLVNVARAAEKVMELMSDEKAEALTLAEQFSRCSHLQHALAAVDRYAQQNLP